MHLMFVENAGDSPHIWLSFPTPLFSAFQILLGSTSHTRKRNTSSIKRCILGFKVTLVFFLVDFSS